MSFQPIDISDPTNLNLGPGTYNVVLDYSGTGTDPALALAIISLPDTIGNSVQTQGNWQYTFSNWVTDQNAETISFTLVIEPAPNAPFLEANVAWSTVVVVLGLAAAVVIALVIIKSITKDVSDTAQDLSTATNNSPLGQAAAGFSTLALAILLGVGGFIAYEAGFFKKT
jgi:hypothetical protein